VAAVEDVGARYQAGDAVVYAGFWRRTAALFIDWVVVGIVYYGIIIAGMVALGLGVESLVSDDGGNAGAMGGMLALLYLTYPVISGLYFAGMEASGTQATLGKMAVGIKVTDAAGRRLGVGQSIGRWVSHLLCYITLYIGYIMAGFTERKRGLHDMVAGTLVVDRWAFTGEPGRQRNGLGTVAVVVLVLGALLMVAYIAVILAIALPAYQGYVERAAAG
jgi:uncharacterized RDD family membrane protein YckC